MVKKRERLVGFITTRNSIGTPRRDKVFKGSYNDINSGKLIKNPNTLVTAKVNGRILNRNPVGSFGLTKSHMDFMFNKHGVTLGQQKNFYKKNKAEIKIRHINPRTEKLESQTYINRNGKWSLKRKIKRRSKK